MYKKILAPLDGSTASGCGVREAIALAVDQAAGLSFLTVIDDSSMWVELSAFISYEDMIEHMREWKGPAGACGTDRGAQRAAHRVHPACRRACPHLGRDRQ